jgi:hypothetical protein
LPEKDKKKFRYSVKFSHPSGFFLVSHSLHNKKKAVQEKTLVLTIESYIPSGIDF